MQEFKTIYACKKRWIRYNKSFLMITFAGVWLISFPYMSNFLFWVFKSFIKAFAFIMCSSIWWKEWRGIFVEMCIMLRNHKRKAWCEMYVKSCKSISMCKNKEWLLRILTNCALHLGNLGIWNLRNQLIVKCNMCMCMCGVPDAHIHFS